MASPRFHLFPSHDQSISIAGRALAHPARILILRLLLANDEVAFARICELVPLARQTVLQHLNYLMESGLVQVREEVPYTFYRAEPLSRLMLSELRDSVDILVSY